MTGDQALKEVKSSIERLCRYMESEEHDQEVADQAIGDVCTFFMHLDEWMRRGGAMPKEWQGDGNVAVNRFVSHPGTCFCNDAPHKRGMGCL